MIVANAQGAFVHDKEFFTGDVSPLSTPLRFLYWGQEYRNSDPLGHMGFLNIKRLVPPSYTSVPGSDSPFDFPLNTMAAIEAREQGGLVTYMHPIGGTTRDVFDTNLGAKESVVTAALGALDTLDLLPYGDSAYRLWYTLLNCGFRIAAGAGTDAFTNWRGINRVPGGSRQYVHVGGTMSWERWIERYREGRSFATTGPLMTFEVNGSEVGEEIRFRPGSTYRATLVADVMSRTPIDRGGVYSERASDREHRCRRCANRTRRKGGAGQWNRAGSPPECTGPGHLGSPPKLVRIQARFG